MKGFSTIDEISFIQVMMVSVICLVHTQERPGTGLVYPLVDLT
jgi:hypothetical protein